MMADMAAGLFAERPWFKPENHVAGQPAGMLGRQEAALLYSLTRDYFAGFGEIIDAGAFLGASAYCLAKGLDDNGRIRHKSGRIHSYDLFRLWQEQGETTEYMAVQLQNIFGIALGDDESTFGAYIANLGPLARHVRVNSGDIRQMRWSGRPIEILFVDIAKTRSIWCHLLAHFFPSLIPGVSIVVHQDYHHPLLPWIHVAQEFLAPFFEIVEPHADDSAAFRLVERIPDRVLERVALHDFTAKEEAALLDGAAARFGADNGHIVLAKAVALAHRGSFAEAALIIDDMHAKATASADPKLEFSFFLASKATTREEINHSPPAEFDESAYLKNNPDVAAAVAAHSFDTGYHHWLVSGRREGRSPRG